MCVKPTGWAATEREPAGFAQSEKGLEASPVWKPRPSVLRGYREEEGKPRNEM